MSDTDPSIALPEAPPARSRTAPVTLGIDPGTKQKINGMVVGLALALMTAVWSRVDSCEAKTTAEEATELGENGAKLAKTAKVEAGAGYQATREKLEATADEVVALRQDLDTARKDLETERRRIDKLLGRRSARVAPRPAPVAPEVQEPLPPTPAAAAAATPGAK